jgi:integrase
MPNLTEKLIAGLKPREGRNQYDLCDSKVTGLGLCYSGGGARTWFIFWRNAEGKNRRSSFGRHDQGMSVREAKQVARARLAEIAKEVKAGVNRPAERHAPTMGDLIDRYLKHAASHIAPSSLKYFEGIARRCFTQELRAQKLSDFNRDQIEELHGAIGRTRGPVAANGWYRLTRLMMNLAVDWKMLQVNPCRRVRLFEETARTEHFSQDQKEKLNVALMQEEHWRWRAYFPLLLLTGLRKSELLKLTWDRVDLAQRTITIIKRKNREPLVQPLLDDAVCILESLPSRGASSFVFPGGHDLEQLLDQPLRNADDAWQRIRARAGITEFRIHSLRHSFASFIINKGIPLFTVGKALGHKSLVSTQRYSHIEQQTVRAAMEQRASAMAIGSIEHQAQYAHLEERAVTETTAVKLSPALEPRACERGAARDELAASSVRGRAVPAQDRRYLCRRAGERADWAADTNRD